LLADKAGPIFERVVFLEDLSDIHCSGYREADCATNNAAPLAQRSEAMPFVESEAEKNTRIKTHE